MAFCFPKLMRTYPKYVLFIELAVGVGELDTTQVLRDILHFRIYISFNCIVLIYFKIFNSYFVCLLFYSMMDLWVRLGINCEVWNHSSMIACVYNAHVYYVFGFLFIYNNIRIWDLLQTKVQNPYQGGWSIVYMNPLHWV